jgi:hypothetical protein
MRTIHKAVLQIVDAQHVMMPAGASILSIGVQLNDICVWYICDTVNAVNERHLFDIYGTGNLMPDGDLGLFLGTVLTHDDSLVWHVFHAGMKVI